MTNENLALYQDAYEIGPQKSLILTLKQRGMSTKGFH